MACFACEIRVLMLCFQDYKLKVLSKNLEDENRKAKKIWIWVWELSCFANVS